MYKQLLDQFFESEIDVMYPNELKNCARLDLSRPFEMCGYYYDPEDIHLTHAHYKDDCQVIGSPTLNIPLLVTLIRTSDEINTINDIQSLHTDKLGEGMLTSWIDIDQLMLLLKNIEAFNEMYAYLCQWKSHGITEVYFSWYECSQSSDAKELN